MSLYDVSKIEDGLFLSSETPALLQSVNGDKVQFNVILSICYIVPVEERNKNVIYHGWEIEDDEKFQINQYFGEMISYIRKYQRQNKRILVHCHMGISRSATVVIAFLMKKYHWSFLNSFWHVKSQRGFIDPNQGFIEQLQTYGKSIALNHHRDVLFRIFKHYNSKIVYLTLQFFIID